MEEMEEEEEYSEDDPRRLRRSDEPEERAEVNNGTEKPPYVDGYHLPLPDGGVPVSQAVDCLWS